MQTIVDSDFSFISYVPYIFLRLLNNVSNHTPNGEVVIGRDTYGLELGGVTPDKINYLSSLHFGGVAMMGAINSLI